MVTVDHIRKSDIFVCIVNRNDKKKKWHRLLRLHRHLRLNHHQQHQRIPQVRYFIYFEKIDTN